MDTFVISALSNLFLNGINLLEFVSANKDTVKLEDLVFLITKEEAMIVQINVMLELILTIIKKCVFHVLMDA